MNPSSPEPTVVTLHDEEVAYLARMWRTQAWQTGPGLALLALVGAALAVGCGLEIAQAPSAPDGELMGGVVMGVFIVAVMAWLARASVREWRVLGQAIADRRGVIEVGLLARTATAPPGAAVGGIAGGAVGGALGAMLAPQLNTRALGVKLGARVVVLPRADWLPHLPLGDGAWRGVVAGPHVFYLLEGGPMSVCAQVPLGLLTTRITVFYGFLAGMLLFLGVGFLGADDSPPAVLAIGACALLLSVPSMVFTVRSFRRNTAFEAAMQASSRGSAQR